MPWGQEQCPRTRRVEAAPTRNATPVILGAFDGAKAGRVAGALARSPKQLGTPCRQRITVAEPALGARNSALPAEAFWDMSE